MNRSSLPKKKINHVAIIMDGNGRWASRKNLPKKIGHEQGIKNCISICRNLKKLNYKINELSFYVFSTENWFRSSVEISNLFKLIETYYTEFSESAHLENFRIRHYGSRKKLSKKLLNIIDEVANKTKDNTGPFINLLFNYGSRQEITDAIVKIQNTSKSTRKIEKYFYVTDTSDPDIIIRTGGEIRLSNFMLWQSAYSELYFTKILWPNFKISNLNLALDEFCKRKRKHGR